MHAEQVCRAGARRPPRAAGPPWPPPSAPGTSAARRTPCTAWDSPPATRAATTRPSTGTGRAPNWARGAALPRWRPGTRRRRRLPNRPATASRTPWNAASAPRRRPAGSAGAPPDFRARRLLAAALTATGDHDRAGTRLRQSAATLQPAARPAPPPGHPGLRHTATPGSAEPPRRTDTTHSPEGAGLRNRPPSPPPDAAPRGPTRPAASASW